MMKKAAFYLLFVLLLGGCTKKAKISLPEREEKLVVTSFISPDDTTLLVVVRSSTPKFSYSSFGNENETIGDAQVMISAPGRALTIPLDPIFRVYWAKTKDFPIHPGETYTLVVTAWNGERVRATTTVPLDTLQILAFEGDLQKSEGMQNNHRMDISYSFEVSDQPGVTNYVAMYHRKNMLIGNDSSGFFGGFDYFDFGTGIFDDDEHEAATSYHGSSRSEMYLDSSFAVEIDLHVLNSSREFYLYNRSVQQSLFVGDNPFAEPVLVYSNVEGGFGCFGSYRCTKRVLKLD